MLPTGPIEIVVPTEARLHEARALLPDTFPALGRPPECLLAERDGEVVGAAAMAWVPNGFPVLVHVRPEARRQGIGRALLATHRAAAQGETAGLRGWHPVDDGSGAAHFLQACGFAVHTRLQAYASDPARLGAAMTALLARMAPRIPPGATLVPPAQAPAAALARLLATHFTVRHNLAALLAGAGAAGWDQALSLALLVDGAVAGAVLARRDGEALEVDLNVVAPEWRGGWANVMLVEGVLRQGRAAGLTRLRFMAEPHVRDTINLARRAGGVRLPDKLAMVLRLQG